MGEQKSLIPDRYERFVPKHKSLSNTFNTQYQKLSISQRIIPANYTK